MFCTSNTDLTGDLSLEVSFITIFSNKKPKKTGRTLIKDKRNHVELPENPFK